LSASRCRPLVCPLCVEGWPQTPLEFLGDFDFLRQGNEGLNRACVDHIFVMSR
jgi:hypothetical protein